MKRALTHGFILFHLIAFACWSSPWRADDRNQVAEWVSPYLLWTGLWQSWEMFAPDPLRVNAHLEAVITFQDGTQTIWAFPRMEKLGYIERYLKERYRKWSSSYIRLDDHAALWPDTARYIARLHHDPSNPPREIQLRRLWMEIPPPLENTNYQPWYREYPHDRSFTFFVYRPTQEDLS